MTFGYTQQNNNSNGVSVGRAADALRRRYRRLSSRAPAARPELDEVGHADPHRLRRRNVCVLVAMESADDADIQRLRRAVEAVLHVRRAESNNRRRSVRLSRQLSRGVRSCAVRQHVDRRVRRVRAHPRRIVGNQYFACEREGETTRGAGRRSGVGCDAARSPRWTGNEIAQPQWEDSVTSADWDTDFRRVFGVAHLNVTDALSFILGFNAIDVQSNGFSYGESQDSRRQRDQPVCRRYVRDHERSERVCELQRHLSAAVRVRHQFAVSSALPKARATKPV